MTIYDNVSAKNTGLNQNNILTSRKKSTKCCPLVAAAASTMTSGPSCHILRLFSRKFNVLATLYLGLYFTATKSLS